MHQTESQTLENQIDQQLAKAGWGVECRNLLEEYLFHAPSTQANKADLKSEFADYVLLNVEAKRSSCDALAGKR